MTFAEAIAAGGVVVFPADTVYGLACDPDNPDAVARLYALKGRPPDKPAAVMFFALADLPAFADVPPVLQTSANLAGGLDARRLTDVPQAIRDGADLVIDGGELAGTPSTVIDLRDYERDGTWRIVRAGAVPEAVIRSSA